MITRKTSDLVRLAIHLGLGLLALVLLAPSAARGADVTTSSAISVLGTPALPPDFNHFPYVNPTAPKGGDVRLAAVGSYDSFNPFILRGRSVAGIVGGWVILPGGSGSGASIGHVWESLLAGSADEAATGYCHLCSTIETAADGSWIAFNLRPEARFSDGVPLTSEDVVWSFNTLVAQGSPGFRIQLAAVERVEADGPHRVVFHFKPGRDRSLPLLVGELPVLPEHFFKGRDFSQPLTAAPIGSGPYKVAAFELGRSVTFERDPNWWARDLPTAIGTNNFGQVRVDYYRDASVALEAFKAGQADIRAENIAKNWAQAYDFPAVRDGRVIKADIRHHLPTGMEGWVMNTRRPMFQGPLVRQAIAWAYDFQWANKNLFFGEYTRTLSYFDNSDLASSGLPSSAQRALLDPFRAALPPELFTEPFTLPVTDGSGHNLKELKQSLAWLEKAGWKVHDMKLVNAQGQQMRFTILLDDPSFERVALPYVQTLKHLGIAVDVRTVDPAQFQRLTDDFDFDMTLIVIPENEIPGNELADDFSCASAKEHGSNNLAGVCDPAVDALIAKVLAAPDRASLRTAARALDRVLLWRWYLVPAWGNQVFHIAYWNRFGQPGIPIRDGVDFDTWWVDAAKAQATDAARAKEWGMTLYLLRRLLLVIPTLFGIIAINFAVIQLAPGGPVEQMLATLRGKGEVSQVSGPTSDLGTAGAYRGARGLDPQTVAQIRKMFGFDKPPLTRFVEMLRGYLTFDFGRSFFRGQTVLHLIAQRLPVSISLGLWSTLLIYLISIPLGIRKAVHDGSRFDVASSAVVLAGYAIPSFLLAILLIVLFAGGSYLHWFPLRGLLSDGAASWPFPARAVNYAWHMVLPTIAIVAGGFASLTILTKNSFIDEIRKQYVVTARAKGASESRVLYGHVFRNAMLLIVAGFPQAFIGILFTSQLLVEIVFSLDGLGLLGFQSAVQRDYPVMFGTLFIFTLLALLMQILGDLLYTVVDPRIDFEARH